MTAELPSREQTTPLDVKIRRAERTMVITWRDGHVSTFDLARLRRECPCAACRTERERQAGRTELFPVLRKDPGTGPVDLVGAELVGHYALQLRWSDGHSTGIYDYRFLRSLDAPGGAAPGASV